MSRATCLLSLEKNVNTPSPASLLNNYLFFVIYIKNNGKSSIKIITCAPLSISLHLSLSGGEWFSSLSGFILAVTKHHLATYPPIQLTLSHIFLQRLHALNWLHAWLPPLPKLARLSPKRPLYPSWTQLLSSSLCSMVEDTLDHLQTLQRLITLVYWEPTIF